MIIKTKKNIRLLFFIVTLETGGAERQMIILARELSNRGYNISVVTMFPGGQFYDILLKIPNIKFIVAIS